MCIRIFSQGYVFICIFQIGNLLRALCHLHSIELPNEATALLPAGTSDTRRMLDEGGPSAIANPSAGVGADENDDSDDMDSDELEFPTELDDDAFVKEEKAEDQSYLKVFEKTVSLDK